VREFQFIDAERSSFRIAFMCYRLGVCTAGYYADVSGPPVRVRLPTRD
jgi:hypothetical protein